MQMKVKSGLARRNAHHFITLNFATVDTHISTIKVKISGIDNLFRLQVRNSADF